IETSPSKSVWAGRRGRTAMLDQQWTARQRRHTRLPAAWQDSRPSQTALSGYAMNDTLRLGDRLRTLGIDLSPEMIAGTAGIVAPLHKKSSTDGVRITRDHRYGPADRNRLDIFEPEKQSGASRPVLLFVHGGGFIQGDKTAPNSPFYDNVGLWAV